MKCLQILPRLCELAGHPSTRHATNIRTHGNDTTYVYHPSPLNSTPWVCVMNFPWVLSMWCWSDYAIIITPHYSQLTLVLFLSLNVSPSPIAHHLYVASPCCTQIYPGVNTIAFFLSMFLCRPNISNMRMSTVSIFCTHMGFLPAIR